MYEAGKAAFGLKASLCLTCYGGIETAFVVTETARSPSLEAKIHRQYWKARLRSDGLGCPSRHHRGRRLRQCKSGL